MTMVILHTLDLRYSEYSSQSTGYDIVAPRLHTQTHTNMHTQNIHTYTYTHIHTHIHTDVHTYTHNTHNTRTRC